MNFTNFILISLLALRSKILTTFHYFEYIRRQALLHFTLHIGAQSPKTLSWEYFPASSIKSKLQFPFLIKKPPEKYHHSNLSGYRNHNKLSFFFLKFTVYSICIIVRSILFRYGNDRCNCVNTFLYFICYSFN